MYLTAATTTEASVSWNSQVALFYRLTIPDPGMGRRQIAIRVFPLSYMDKACVSRSSPPYPLNWPGLPLGGDGAVAVDNVCRGILGLAYRNRNIGSSQQLDDPRISEVFLGQRRRRSDRVRSTTNGQGDPFGAVWDQL